MTGSGNETFERDRSHGRTEVEGASESAHHKSTPEGEVRTQRGRPADIDPALMARGHDPRDASARAISWAMLGLAGFAVASAGAVALLLGAYSGLEPPPSATALERATLVPPRPRLERKEGEDRPALEAAARDQLADTGPVPGEPGRSRIPIERAMELLAERGWPDPDDASRPAARPSDTVPGAARVPAVRDGGAAR